MAEQRQEHQALIVVVAVVVCLLGVADVAFLTYEHFTGSKPSPARIRRSWTAAR
jgi:hypothetical protein